MASANCLVDTHSLTDENSTEARAKGEPHRRPELVDEKANPPHCWVIFTTDLPMLPLEAILRKKAFINACRGTGS
ncbi:unnamed protein product [Soboliphyme baturini]|uniref:Uncharacterized protein n=1 Tax=Soboliphyme baturini TaxID=241478 RepID=A0A183IJW3_9BILA|nr:unnamed protein product [Soboliphyme baturini]